MQSTSRFIGPLRKFTARMWHSKDNSSRRQVLPLVKHRIKRHSPSFVPHSHPALSINTHPDMLTKTCYGFINRIIQCLPDQMEQARGGSRTYIHTGPMSDSRNSL